MRSLIWKEWRENLKWAAGPGILLLGPMIFFGVPMLLEEGYLGYVSLVAGLSGALLGFIQVFAEARGDKRSLLLHRPLTPSRIFLGKVLAGVSLYLLALLVPSACAVVLAATPGHVAAPFEGGMALPWLADVLTGLVYYFAGMIVAQREARWYGSQGIPLAAGAFTSVCVWNVVEFWQALVVIGVMSGLVAVAAWGSVSAGGAYARQSSLSKFALGGTLLLGLSAMIFGVKVMIGSEFLSPIAYYPFEMGRKGQILVVPRENDFMDGRIQSITDLAGAVPEEIAGERLDAFAFRQAVARGALAGVRAKTIGYRRPSRFFAEFRNDTTPNTEVWRYVLAQRQVLGYDKQTKHLIGKFGPSGFADADQPMQEPFEGMPALKALGWESWVRYPLALPGGAFTVDFRKGSVKKVFSPPPGETVLWASQRADEREKWFHMYVGTDQALYVFDEAGVLVCRAPLVGDLDGYRLMAVGRLDRPRRYWVWYSPQWHLPRATLVSMPEGHVIIYDQSGTEIPPRQTLPPRSGVVRDFPSSQPLVGPSAFQALSGLATSPAELAALVGTLELLEADARHHEGREVAPLGLLGSTQLYIPGIAYDLNGHGGLVAGFAGLMLLASAASALVCFVVPGRYAFSRARRLGWALLGLWLGPVGLLLMFTLLEWPGQVACPKCRKPRVVTNDHCEHCGAEHAPPEADGTEIFDRDTATRSAALV
jgi:hypothetical protein